jgi:transcriptional regulator with XRE-family HTH domain
MVGLMYIISGLFPRKNLQYFCWEDLMSLQAFGRNLKNLRNAARLNQDGLGKDVGFSQGYISRLEKGEVRPGPELIDALAKKFGCSPWALVGGTDLASESPGECLVTVDPTASLRWLAYFASALTGLKKDQRDILEVDADAVRQTCEQIGAYLYEPSHYTDPERNKNISAQEVYSIDRAQVSRSDVVILYGRYPSFGAGQELDIAMSAGLPLVFLIPDDQPLSRMVRGTYASVHELPFASCDDLRNKLPPILARVINNLTLRKDLPVLKLGERVRQHRESIGLEAQIMARAVGLSEQAIHQLENGLYENPSLITLRRLALTLKTTVSALVDGLAMPQEDMDPIMRKSKDGLNEFAMRQNISYPDAKALWDAHAATYANQRRTVAEARTEPVSVREWGDRYREFKNPSGRQRAIAFPDD